jgi:hypothetical protein
MEVKREGNKLTITVELTAGRPSSTGKSVILFSSEGFKWYEDIGISLNVIKSRKAPTGKPY